MKMMAQYGYRHLEFEHGPISREDLEQLIAGGLLLPTTLVWEWGAKESAAVSAQEALAVSRPDLVESDALPAGRWSPLAEEGQPQAGTEAGLAAAGTEAESTLKAPEIRLHLTCHRCATTIAADWRYCAQCGTPLRGGDHRESVVRRAHRVGTLPTRAP